MGHQYVPSGSVPRSTQQRFHFHHNPVYVLFIHGEKFGGQRSARLLLLEFTHITLTQPHELFTHCPATRLQISSGRPERSSSVNHMTSPTFWPKSRFLAQRRVGRPTRAVSPRPLPSCSYGTYYCNVVQSSNHQIFRARRSMIGLTVFQIHLVHQSLSPTSNLLLSLQRSREHFHTKGRESPQSTPFHFCPTCSTSNTIELVEPSGQWPEPHTYPSIQLL